MTPEHLAHLKAINTKARAAWPFAHGPWMLDAVEELIAEVERLRAERDALPPLPEGWVSNGDVDTYRWCEFVGPDGHLVHVDGCGVHVVHAAIDDVVVADLITVMRHAEREHQRLKAGGGK